MGKNSRVENGWVGFDFFLKEIPFNHISQKIIQHGNQWKAVC